MTRHPDWWQAVSPHLDQLLDMPPTERTAWLATLGQHEPALADQLVSLMHEHAVLAGEGFLEDGLDVPAADGPTLVGTAVGAYTIVAPIGAGGMGTVWLGERADGEIQRQVAIKFLASGSYRQGWRDRFLRERQLLASLSHPSIVHLLDAGHATDGRPYLVMEYIKGDPIDVYAERVSVEERLTVFLRLCDAVSYAHQRLIIHRDLKPSNVLVDAAGHPKVLDFGIAKLLDDTADATRTIDRLMTPAYASPEQRRGDAQTTATDIYSLGAILYRLLTGQVPGDGPGPSPESDTAPREIAPPSRLNPSVPRDADYLVRKALRDEPEQRYGSVDAFASDVRALLQSKPVEARSGDGWYRARKFLQRNRVAVAAAAVVIVSLSTGLYVANRQRAIAQERFQQVRQLANRFIALDEELRQLDGTTDIRSRIVVDALKYLEALGRDAGGDPELSLEIGTAYQQVARVQGVPFIPNLGLLPQAEESLHKADRFIDAVLAEQPDNRQALFTSAQIAHDLMALVDNMNRRGDALAAARRAAERLDRFFNGYTPSPDDINAATQIYSNVGVAYSNSTQPEESIRYARRALDISAGVEAARMRRASASGVLSISLRRVGDLDGALVAGQESRRLLEELPLESSQRFNLINALQRVGQVLGEAGGPNLGRIDEALVAFQQGLDIAEGQASRDATDFRSRVAVAAMSLEIGNILRHSDPARALSLYEHALARLREIDANVRGESGVIDLLTMSSYALRALGREAEARAQLAESFRLLETAKEYPTDSIEPQSGADNALRALAAQHEAVGELARAAETYRELAAKLEAWRLKPADDLRDATVLSDAWAERARLLRRLGNGDDADMLDRRRAELWRGWERKRPDNVFIKRQLELSSGRQVKDQRQVL
jgi:tetratricopeptide (TPR) repeat protein